MEYVNRWNEIVTEISGTLISVPRDIGAVLSHDHGSTLWIFGDASQLAISCCSYVTHLPSHHTKGLLSAKTRLAPKEKQLSIPRLELLAILISLRLAKTILRSYKGRIKLVRIVNDSRIALAWIQTTKRLPLFVANQVERIKKLRRIIHQLGALVEFNYIESKNNPADVATRPTTKEAFEASDWLPGPQWFKTQEASWPIESSTDLNEMVGNESHDEGCNTPICASAVKTSTQINDSIMELSPFRHYSQALKALTRAVKMLKCWITRFNTRNKRNVAPRVLRHFSADSELTSEEIKAAEYILLREQTK
ncbi:hypothetical protein GCK32_022806, partial [Trichostrongylus colubriformis]